MKSGGGVVPGIYTCEVELLQEYLLGALYGYLEVDP